MQRFQPADSENHSAARALSGPSNSGKARNIMRSRSQGDKPYMDLHMMPFKHDGHVLESCARFSLAFGTNRALNQHKAIDHKVGYRSKYELTSCLPKRYALVRGSEARSCTVYSGVSQACAFSEDQTPVGGRKER